MSRIVFFLRHALKQLWVLFCYGLVGIVENAVFGWGDMKLGITNETVDSAIHLVLSWGIPALTVLALMCAYYLLENYWFSRWRRIRLLQVITPNTGSLAIAGAVPVAEQDQFVSMTEAAILAYEEARKAGSIWAYAAEKLGAKGMDGSSSENEILNYMATFIAGKIPIYGAHPPSRNIEEIDEAETKHGRFKNGASEFRFLFGKSPTYTNIKVKTKGPFLSIR
jgi:hypothetical protein